MTDAPAAETTTREHRLKAWEWRPGESGNPRGRPKGSKHRLAEDFLRDLAEDWPQNGASAIKTLRERDVATYVRVVAATLPKELDVTVDAPFADATSVLEAYRLASALIGADPERATAALRRAAPHLLIESK